MFTGLVEALGTVASRQRSAGGARLVVHAGLGALTLGESIAVDGACLTVTRATGEGFEADVSNETLARTTLGELREGARVNLERSLSLGDRLGGHLVSGHVDATATLSARAPLGEAVAMTFRFPPGLAGFIAEKGSVAVHGVSLTVNAVGAETFDVAVIPHTARATSLGALSVGAAVNLEVDLLARYVARLLSARVGVEARSDDAAWIDRLRRSGLA